MEPAAASPFCARCAMRTPLVFWTFVGISVVSLFRSERESAPVTPRRHTRDHALVYDHLSKGRRARGYPT
jgi:hypothetical protein